MTLIIFTLYTQSHGIYSYRYMLDAYSLSRDSRSISYIIKRDYTEGYTNNDVELIIDFNKKIEAVQGFELLNDGTRLRRVLSGNEKFDFVVNDIYGNKANIKYEVKNIDKIAPTIIGVEDGEVYDTDVTINYDDNIGIAKINVDKYGDFRIIDFPDYYDCSEYKGISLLDTSSIIYVKTHPLGTKRYRYYLDNVLMAETEDISYKFTNLERNTAYVIKVEAIDKNGNILDSKTRNIKTKIYSKVECQKNSNNYIVRVYGIDPNINLVRICKFLKSSIETPIYYDSAPRNGYIEATLDASELSSAVINDEYYFLHIQLYKDSINNLQDVICFNIIFNQEYQGMINNIDYNHLVENGNYEITVIDLAGNETKKNIKIDK